MDGSHSVDLATRLIQVLATQPPAKGLAAALEMLAPLGATPLDASDLTGRDETPWLSVTAGDRKLHLCAPREAVEGPQRDQLAGLLQLALMRDEEHQQHQQAQERMTMLSSVSFEGLFIHIDGTVIDVNQRLADMLGYNPEDLLGERTLWRCIAPEDVPRVQRMIAERYEGAYPITAVRKDGSRFPAELQANQGKLGDRPVRVLVGRDVTDRERAQRLLRESELRLRTLVERTFDFTVYTRNAVIVDAAGPLERVLGYTPDEVIGLSSLDFVDEAVKQRITRSLGRQLDGSYESSILAKDGERVPVEVVSVMSTLRGEPVRVSAMRDLRPLKRLERDKQQLQRDFERSQRLDSLGVLAGGIAHDFNNILVGILGYADLLHEHVASPLGHELLQGILDASHRAAGLTAQMLAYAGRKELGPRGPIDLGELLDELRNLLGATLSKKANLSTSSEPGLRVLGNRATLTQVMMNLLTNASDALGDSAGAITARLTRVDEPDARFARSVGAAVSQGQWILLEVSDSGAGMDEATQSRIFEPFFTTKRQGHGLGLAACVGIVAAHGGAIHVDSAPGRGSTFSVLLPAHVEAPAEDTVGPAATIAPPDGPQRRVLVVDDEVFVRSQLRIALSNRGYEVEEAQSGREALAALERGPQNQPDLVILDVTMPDLSGLEVLQQIRAEGSDVPVVLSSGYHDATLELPPESFSGFLVKPYRLADVYTVVEGALGGPGSQASEE